MAPGAPPWLKAVFSHIRHRFHQFIDARDQVRDMIHRSVRRNIERDVVMLGFRPQKDHLSFAPVRYAKTQYARIKFRDSIKVRRVEDDVADGMRRHSFQTMAAAT